MGALVTHRGGSLAAQRAPIVADLLESAGAGIMAFDNRGACHYWNRCLEDLCGIPAVRALGRSASDLFPDAAGGMLADRLQVAREGEAVRLALELPGPGRDGAWVDATFTPWYDADGTVHGVVGVVHEANGSMAPRQSAQHDPLTGLANRTHFVDMLERAAKRARRNPRYAFAVLFLDLDRFKLINDSLGHAVGDELLVEVASRLEGLVRPGDLVARLGGDEFAVIMYNITAQTDAAELAARFQARLAEPYRVGGREVFTSGSVGIALSSGRYELPEDLLRYADIAMYKAKAEGRGRCVVFGEEMHEHTLTQLQIETDLRNAVDREEFVLFYQPIFRLDTMELDGFEALLRWNRHGDQPLSPGHFMEVAEDTGLILPIGRWVLREAIRQLEEWHRRLRGADHLSLHVNLSAKQFIQPDGIGEIIRAVSASDLPHGSIKLEITESIILENAEEVAHALQRLRRNGLALSIDDFGTGYSSLRYLHQFPFDTVKIDRSFLGRSEGVGSGMEIVRTILALAHNLEMSAVAEGIETPEQFAALRELGCEFGQGYYLAEPMPAEAAERFLVQALPGRRERVVLVP